MGQSTFSPALLYYQCNESFLESFNWWNVLIFQGVQIPNFGTFSFSQRRLDIGNNKFLQSQRPVFNISEKFAQTLGLQFNKYNVPGM